MEKLVISKEQEEAFLKYTDSMPPSVHLKYFIDNHKEWCAEYGSLSNFTPQQFALLLCGWYKVKEPFKVGDWVKSNSTSKVARIDERGVMDDRAWVDDFEVNFFIDFRHATPEEIAQEKKRRFWAELGREVDEYKIGDIVAKNGNVQEISGVLRDGWKIQTYSLPVYNDELTLICPVERRMDT